MPPQVLRLAVEMGQHDAEGGGEIKGTASTGHLHPQPLCISLFACAFAHQGRRVLTRTVGEERKRARSWQLKQAGSPRKTETQVSSETGEHETAVHSQAAAHGPEKVKPGPRAVKAAFQI